MPQVANRGFRLDQQLYDTMQLTAAADQIYDFFTVPLGGALTAAAVKTYAHTNLVNAGQLPQGVAFTLTGISMSVRQAASGGDKPTFADYQVLEDGWLEIILDDQNWGRYPNCTIPGDTGLSFFSDSAAAPVLHVHRGVQHVQNVRWLTEPIEFVQQQNFRVRLHVPGTPGAVTDVMIFLWGPYTRPVA